MRSVLCSETCCLAAWKAIVQETIIIKRSSVGREELIEPPCVVLVSVGRIWKCHHFPFRNDWLLCECVVWNCYIVMLRPDCGILGTLSCLKIVVRHVRLNSREAYTIRLSDQMHKAGHWGKLGIFQASKWHFCRSMLHICLGFCILVLRKRCFYHEIVFEVVLQYCTIQQRVILPRTHCKCTQRIARSVC